MKKIISILILSALVFSAFCFVGCSQINEKEVAVLWSGNGEIEDPNSLINALERTMYIENIASTNYGANGNAETQLKQAKEAIDRDCDAVVIELIDPTMAKEIVDYARAKDVPVVFFNTIVEESIVNSYDKCALVISNFEAVYEIQGKLIADYVKANYADVDKNEDKKITACVDGAFSEASIGKANELLKTEDYKVSASLFDEKFNVSIEIKELEIKKSELVVTASELNALNVLVSLQKDDYNTDKLATQFVPIFTVGGSFDLKSAILASRPAIPENLVIKDGDDQKTIDKKNQEIKKLSALAAYYEKNKYLIDLTAVNESDLKDMIYTTVNVIDSGRIAGTAIEDYDSIAAALSAIVRNLIKGDAMFEGIASEKTKVEKSVVMVKYTTYGG